MNKFRSAGAMLACTLIVTIAALAWWSPGQAPPGAISGQDDGLTPLDVSARVRLIARLGRNGRLNEANHEAHLLMRRTPAFSARQWVTDAYQGVRREDEREENIRLLVSLGLPEHPVQRR